VEFALMADDAIVYDAKAVEKNLKSSDGAGLSVLRDLKSQISKIGDWTPGSIHAFIEGFAKDRGFVTEKGVNVGPVAQPLRVALTGTAVSPPLGETLAVLGRESAIRRMDRCLAEVK
jgi:glutamyl-tRNA synthetase